MCNDLVWQSGSQTPRIVDTAHFLSADCSLEQLRLRKNIKLNKKCMQTNLHDRT